MRNYGGRVLVYLLAFAVGVGCFYLWSLRRAGSGPGAPRVVTARPTPLPQTQAAVTNAEPADAADTAPRGPIGRIDFRNFTYPRRGGDGPIEMKGGEIEYEDGGCLQRYSIAGVDYPDFTGDGEEEALVRLVHHAACGSSWLSVNYYVYTVRGGRPRLLWDFVTGSEAHGGEKDFRVEGKELVFELYGTWRADGGGLAFKENREFADDCCPTHYTVSRVAWDGKRFRPQSVEVLPFTRKSIY